ncbi:MAG: hypothetical protein SNJ78_10540, partial [Spirochaetales bacterium]
MHDKSRNSRECIEELIHPFLGKLLRTGCQKAGFSKVSIPIRVACRIQKGAFLCLLFLGTLSLFPQTLLNEEFWYDSQPEVWKWEANTPSASPPSLSPPLPSPPNLRSIEKEELYERILEEARYVFSGMVYGFVFSYTPSDKARRVEEEFLLEPYH